MVTNLRRYTKMNVNHLYQGWYDDKFKPVLVIKTGHKFTHFIVNDPSYGVCVRKAADTGGWRDLGKTTPVQVQMWIEAGKRLGITKQAKEYLTNLNLKDTSKVEDK